MERSFELTLKAEISEIPRVSAALENVMLGHSFSNEEILDAQLAVEEAVTNIIMHGYEGHAGEIHITCHATRGIIEIQIEDTAPLFNPLSVPDPDVTTDIQDRRMGGLGIFLIRRVMDDVMYRNVQGKNILVLIKRKSG
ncbi:MAG TPA: ATP-binding protein [Methanoregula sp.]|nr:ATP-binding protein [Methanoregula sp.]